MGKHFFIASAFLCGMLLTACGGSQTDTASLSDTTPESRKFEDLLADQASLSSIWSDVGLSDPAALPASGTASYVGIVRMAVETGGPETALAGDLRMNVDFATNNISGSANGFQDSANNNYTGSLTVPGAVIDRSADLSSSYTFAGDIGGTLTRGESSFVVDAILGGDFHGAGQGAMSGAIEGLVSDGAGSGLVTGDFIAAQ